MSGIKRCGEDLSGFVKLGQIQIKQQNSKEVEIEVSSFPATEGFLGLLLDNAPYLRGAICYYPAIDNSDKSGYYMAKDVYPKYESMVNNAVGESFFKFTRMMGIKGKLLVIENEFFGVNNEEVAKMLQYPPSSVSKVDNTKWALLQEPFTAELIAQIRALCKKHEIDDKIFQREEGTSSYYVKKDINILSLVIDRLIIVKANMRVGGEAERKIEKFRLDIIVGGFINVKDDIEKEKIADRWGVGEIVATVGLVGVLAFGIGSPFGHDIYLLGKGGVIKLWRKLTNDPKWPRGGGGTPTGGKSGGDPAPQTVRKLSRDTVGSDMSITAPSWGAAGALATASAMAMMFYAIKEECPLVVARAYSGFLFAVTLAAPTTEIAEEEYLRFEERIKGGQL